ncbi:hypothetical protein LTR17_025274 [Elasticomyces elasticus]|nr:hypothetical protein LTR17_025274 [Elasticomyces elasticus]
MTSTKILRQIFMTLPAELRLDIYERILRFDCPLRRIKPIEELDGTLDDDLRQFVRGGPADISILFACCKTFDEALPILYKQNTISLCHNDVCILRREFGNLGFTRCIRELLTQAVVVDWLESGSWTTCKACSGDVYSFFGAFNSTNFPKLKLVTFDLERFEGGYAALGEQLLSQGVEPTLTFKAPGYLTLSAPVTIPRLDFRFNDIASTWAYYAAKPRLHAELHHRASIVPQMQGVHKRFVLYVRQILWKYWEWVMTERPDALLVEAQALLRGVDLRWFDAESGDAMSYEKLTDKLLQRLEALKARR